MIVLDAATLAHALLGRDTTAERTYWTATARDPLPLSAPVQAALLDLLTRPFLARYLEPTLIADVLGALRARAAWFEPRSIVTECRDQKDNRYLELALAAGATAIVSQDEDLLTLQTFRGIRIMRPAKYLTTHTHFI